MYMENHSYNLLLPLHYLYLSYLSELLSLPPYQEVPQLQQGSSSTSTSGLTPLPASRLPNGLGCELISARIVKSDMTGALLRGESVIRVCSTEEAPTRADIHVYVMDPPTPHRITTLQ